MMTKQALKQLRQNRKIAERNQKLLKNMKNCYKIGLLKNIIKAFKILMIDH